MRQNVYLGRATTYGSNIAYMTTSVINMNQYGDNVEDFQRYALGPIYVSGSTVVEDSHTGFNLDITSGYYFYGTSRYYPPEEFPTIFIQRYRNGLGGWIDSYTGTVNSTSYDNNSITGLQNLATGYYAKHSFYTGGATVAEQTYLLVVSQDEYSTLAAAQVASLPIPPDDFINSTVLIADIIVQQGQTNITQIDDQRPRVGFKTSAISATADHTQLLNLNLGNAGHHQFMMLDGSTPMAGLLNMNSNAITNITTANGVTIQTHEARHLPNGADPLVTAAPTTSLNPSSTGYVGIANSLARSDHTHAITGFQTTGNYITYISGDVSATGPNGATGTVNSVGGSSAENIHTAEQLANAATNINTTGTIVKRDATGNFNMGGLMASTGDFSGLLTVQGGITGSVAFFNLITVSQLTGSSVFNSTITGTNIYGTHGFFSQIVTPSVTGEFWFLHYNYWDKYSIWFSNHWSIWIFY